MALTQSPEPGMHTREIHDILRNDRRRNVIEHLQNHAGPTSVRVLSERIAEKESGESPAPRKLRESVYNSLHQTHLPKLDEQGVVNYDRNRKDVEVLEGARQINIYMEVVTRYGITWATYYRTLAVASLLLIVAANAGVPLLSDIPTLVVATGFLALIGASTAYQLWSRRWFYLRTMLN